MALPPIEIRYRKNAFYLFMAIAILPMIMVSCVVFTASPSWTLYLAYLFALVAVFFIFRWLILTTRSDRPVLVFESHAMTVNSRKSRTIPWSSITQWKIRRDKGGDTLIIRTTSGKVSVQLTWLDIPSKEIKRLMESYIDQPGPGGHTR